MANLQAHHSRVAATTATGIGVPSEAAISRSFTLRLFYRLGVSSNGRPGGRGRKARRCFSGTPTPVSVAHPIGVGSAVQNRNWSTTMTPSTPTPAKGIPYRRAYDVAGIVSDARYIASTLADVVPESIHGISVDDLGRLGALASAVARLMATAEESADALASDLHDIHISLTQGA